jgi:xanthine dehydrogenase accessory factor
MARKLADSARRNLPGALLSVIDPGIPARASLGARAVLDPTESSNSPHPLGLEGAALDQINERVTDAIPGLLEIDPDGTLHPAARVDPNGSPRLFVDPISGAQRLIIAGAGHIAQPLAALGSMLGFHVTVIDDRGQFANRERFPTADEIIVRRFRAALDSLWLDRHCYVISVTRGHAFDDEVVRAVLHQAVRDPRIFIGMIGSRRRVKTTLERIAADGISRALLEQIHAPLGIDIGAETPEEIAVAIIGEVIRERRIRVRDDFNLGTKLGQLKRSDGIRPAARPRPPAAAAPVHDPNASAAK